MPRLKTIRRFEEWKKVPENIEGFFRLLEGDVGVKPLRFRDACLGAKVPYTLMYVHLHGEPELKARYESILAARADDMMHERLDIAKNVEPERDKVAKAKLECEVLGSTASYWDRERYGERPEVAVNVTQWVLRLPAPAASTAEWKAQVERNESIINPVPAPALEAPKRGEQVSEPALVSEPAT